MSKLLYALLDSGNQQRLERFGEYTLIRPCSQAVWQPKYPELWDRADALFTRDEGNRWVFYQKIPYEWKMHLGEFVFKISPTDFGHLGIFPEHHEQWAWMEHLIKTSKQKTPNILNLFAYSGAATVKLARCGAKICHVDSSKKSVSWAADNASLNTLKEAPIRWIVEDAMKFLQREVRRGSSYDAIIVDPPSFGKGAKGEIFKIESDIGRLLDLCKKVLVKDPLFILFTCHTPGFTPSVMKYLLEDMMGKRGCIESGEMLISSEKAVALPSGVFARWSAHA
jgi:23S rRNA (cytosine1962-C5)-methyltransferase